MNFDQLKKMAKKLGGVLVLNGNEPEFVILPYGHYQKIGGEIEDTGGDRERQEPDKERTVEELNREILSLKEEVRQKESAELTESMGGRESITDTTDPIGDLLDLD